MVVATQNPVEYEGTYPLPEAQLDRFLLKLTMPLPARDDEIEVLTRHADGFDPRDLAAAGVRPVAGVAELAAGRAAVRTVQIAPEVVGYVVDLSRATRHVAVAAARRLAARRDRAAVGGPRLGLAVRPRLRDPRRRQGAGPAGAAAPGRSCAPRPSWRASPPTRCSTASSAPSPCRADGAADTWG